jgi:Domain of unknown function (DUF4410)
MTSTNQHVGKRVRWAILAAALSVTACTGTHVRNVVSVAREVSPQPPRTIAIVVENDSPAPKHARHDDAHQADVNTTQAALLAQLSAVLKSQGLVVVRPGQAADIVLLCQITQVQSGNEALRLIVGYGVGKADLRVTVALADQRSEGRPTLLSFEARSTTGVGGGAAMGVASGGTLGDVKAVLSVPGTMKHNLPSETEQTTAHIDSQIATYFKTRSWPLATGVAVADESAARSTANDLAQSGTPPK